MPLRLSLVVVDPAADVRGQCLGNLRTDVGAVVAANFLERLRVVAHGDIRVFLLQRGDGVDVTRVISDDVGLIQHVNNRQPCFALVDGVFNRAGAVLVLCVVAVKTEVHVLVIA